MVYTWRLCFHRCQTKTNRYVSGYFDQQSTTCINWTIASWIMHHCFLGFMKWTIIEVYVASRKKNNSTPFAPLVKLSPSCTRFEAVLPAGTHKYFFFYLDSCLSEDRKPYYGPTVCQDMVQRLPYHCYTEPYKLDCCRECLKIADDSRKGSYISTCNLISVILDFVAQRAKRF